MTLAIALFALQAALPMVTISQGSSSQILRPREVVAKDADEWRDLWAAHSAVNAPAEGVDWSRFMVVGIFLGSRPSAGYSVAITNVTSRDGTTTVEYTERSPAPGTIAAQVLTSPFHILRIPRTTERIVFRRAP
jgi:hypothetical protein